MTKDIPVPPDPIRVKHDALFQGVFEELREAGVDLIELREIPNQYFKDVNNCQPWYQFLTPGAHAVMVGPRKRVYEISVVPAHIPNWIPRNLRSPIRNTVRTLGERDKVTFEESSKEVLIHAWGREKLVEYLKAILLPGEKRSSESVSE